METRYTAYINYNVSPENPLIYHVRVDREN